MSLEIKVNDSFVPFEFAPVSEKIALEWAIVNNAEIKVNCVTCHKEIPAGTGNACAQHTSYKVCKICELPHAGRYCSNCFTGYRERCGKGFAMVIRLTPNNCKSKSPKRFY